MDGEFHQSISARTPLQMRLINDQFEVKHLTAILKDGLHVLIPSEQNAPVPLAEISTYMASRTRLGIFLVIPSAEQKGGNILVNNDNGEEKSRFVASSLPVYDEVRIPDRNEIPQPRKIDVLEGRFELRPETASMEGWEAIKIAEIVNKDGKLIVDDQFVPPSLSITTNEYLPELLQSVSRRLLSKLNALDEKKRQIATQPSASPDDARTLSFLGNTASVLPLLYHLQKRTGCHPEKLYEVLLQVAGMLYSFSKSSTVSPWNLPNYQHDDGGTCFRKLENAILTMLDQVEVKSSHFTVDLKQREDNSNIQFSSVHQSALNNCVAFLQVNAVQYTQDELKGDIPRMVRVASNDSIDDIIERMGVGIKLRYKEDLPAGIPKEQFSVYFELEQDHELWDDIVSSKSIAVYVSPNLPGVSVSIVGQSMT